MATLRSTSGSVFGSISSLAGSVGVAADALSGSLSLASGYITRAQAMQEWKGTAELKKAKAVYIAEAEREMADLTIASAKYANKSAAHAAALETAKATVADWFED